MRPCLVFLIGITLFAVVSCGRGRKRNKAKKITVANAAPVVEVENNEEEEEQTVEEEVEEVEEEDLSETHLTCIKGYNAVANIYNGKVLNTCKTELNNNCVTVFIQGDTPAKSAYLYGCYPSYDCSKFESYLEGLPGSYCKMCNSKYDKCNQDL